jgi:lipoate-protein ligase A
MQRIDRTLPSPAENLALDEAFLELAEGKNADYEFLRLWESPQSFVVVGRSSRIRQEVDEPACTERGIPILRRSSGGAAVVVGPGCLMYAVVLSLRLRPELKDIGHAHAFVLGRLAEALIARLPNIGTISRAGTSDLVLSDGRSPSVLRKFSGNSLRMKRTHLLYHGTLLYAFDLSLLGKYLKMPPKQPKYRETREHLDFVTNLPATRQQLMDALGTAWPTENNVVDIPSKLVAELVQTRYGSRRWNYDFA